MQRSNLIDSVKQLLFRPDDGFEDLALQVFNYQAANNPVYSEYIQKLHIKPASINSIERIPFLPISFFKSHEVKSGVWIPQAAFESSGTTGLATSRHYVRDVGLYDDISTAIFEQFYGKADQYHILALLPSYLERNNSSLVRMVDNLIKNSDSPYSGFYLNDFEQLLSTINHCKSAGRQILLLGVSFALLDFIEWSQVDLSGHIVMETGGMKGRRRELIRQELHDILKNGFNVKEIHSEYGMTELLSQAYAKSSGGFTAGNTMRILLRDMYDPFDVSDKKKSGGVNVIDLANIDTCSFIETQDIGAENQGVIEILGRFDQADIRGCNLMVSV